jgi:AcrR family transcriptional regulator
MEDVANEASMGRATLYRHFKDRDALCLSVIEREALIIASEIYPQLKEIDDIGDYIVEGILLAVDAIKANDILYELFKPDSIALSNSLLLVTNRLSLIGIDVLTSMLEPAKKEGTLREDLPVAMMMDWILRILTSLLTVPSEATSTRQDKEYLLKQMLLPALLKRV